MKCLFLFPPQWIPFNPHLASAAIQSILRNNDHEVNFRDLNVEFYNVVLSPQFIVSSIDRAFNNYNTRAREVFEARLQKKDLNEFPEEFKRVFLRYKEIERISKENAYPYVVQDIKKALAVIRDKRHFYNPYLLDKAFSVVKKATDILSSVYYPSKVNFLNVRAQTYNNINDLKFNCNDKEGNIFWSFYQMILSGLLKVEADYIGISLGDYTQIIPGLTLSMLLKANTKAHICIGGNLFGRHTGVITDQPEFFKIFADSVIYNEGEKPILELLRHLEGKIKIEDVPNLIYLSSSEGLVKNNNEVPPITVSELYPPDFTRFPFNLYYTPEVIFNIQASRSCYWRKCSFCTHYFGSRYAIKNVNKTVAELKDLQQRFGARYFHFVDEAMSPSYLGKLSEKILEEGLDINYYIYGRLEKEFTPELLTQASASGLRLVLWGFESANERVYRLMNKGELCSSESRLNILKSAFEADIWNHLFIMFGFPSESFEEAKETVHFLRDNRNIVSHSLGSVFVLLEGSPILENPEKYSITKVQRMRSGFSFAHRFETSDGMKPEEIQELEKYKANEWKLGKYRYKDSSYREKLFLYVCKYGTKNISKMKDKIWL